MKKLGSFMEAFSTGIYVKIKTTKGNFEGLVDSVDADKSVTLYISNADNKGQLITILKQEIKQTNLL